MKGYTLSLATKTLTITKAFEDAVSKGEGEAYDLYTKFMREIPGLTVVRKTHATPTKYTSKSTGEKFKCNQFKNLTYANMERFMDALPHGNVYRKEYDFLKDYASRIQTNGYKLVRMWFVAQFPEFRKNPLFYVYNTPDLVKASDMIAENKAIEMESAA